MLALDNLHLRYGHKLIFGEISANINVRDKIGLVGSNGVGKSTLLKAIMGKLELDGGNIEKANYVTLGYLPQDGLEIHGRTLYAEVESAFSDILSLQNSIQSMEQKLHEINPESPDYTELLEMISDAEHRLEELDAAKLKSKIETILQGLGFSMKDMERDCGEFSGGWQMRIALAKLLLREPSLLLLDEPTNHLDITSQSWLENYLKRYEGAMIIISHDRGFLDLLCNKTFELTLGRLQIYNGNYSFYEKESVQRKLLTEQAYKNQQKKLKKTEEFIDRFRYKSSKAKQVQSRIKALDKVERIEIEEEENAIGFSFPEAPPSGHNVLKVEKLHKYYDEKKIFQGINLNIERGDKIAIVGVNGAGKSTLAKIIAGVEPCTSGTIEFGHNVRHAYFAQQQAEALEGENTALEIVEAAAEPGIKANYRNVLGSFLFSGDDVFKKAKVLSGGEKCRLALACMLVKKANLMILDEPTNHLDMKSQDILQRALKKYQGTLLIVSHNRSFLDPIVNKVLEVRREGIRIFLGNVSYYLEKIEMEDLQKLAYSDATPKKNDSPQPPGTSAKEQRRLNAQKREALKPLKNKKDAVEQKIEELEQKKSDYDIKMADPEFFKQGEETTKAMKDYHSIERKLENLMKEWENLTEEIDNLS